LVDSGASLTEGLTGATGGVVESGASLTGGLVESDGVVGSLTGALTTTIDTAGTPLGETVGSLTTPLTATLETAVPSLNETVAGVGGSLTTTLDATAGPLGESVNGLTGPLTTTLNASEPAPAPSSGSDAGAAPGGGEVIADGSGGNAPAAHAPQTVVDGTASTIAPTAADGASAFVNETAPGLGSVLGMPTPAQVLSGDGAGTVYSAPPVFPEAPGIAGEAPGTGIPSDPAIVAPAQSPLPDDSLLGAIAELAPDPRVLVSAAVLTVVAGSLIGARGPAGAPDMRMAFTNVRLMPCIVKAGLERQIETLNLIIARGGGTPAAAGATAVGGGVPAGPAPGGVDADGQTRFGGAAHAAVDLIPKLFDSAREGFDQVVRDAADEATDGLSDARLMTQIGMLFGFVYLGFVTIWFWVTRVRRSFRI